MCLPVHLSFPTDHSKAVPLLQFFFVYDYVISYVAFVVTVPHLYFVWCFGREDCGS